MLKEVIKLLPEYSYIYLGDNARAPYGSHSDEVIYKFTAEGVRALFAKGAELIILACNTASSVALRRIQQEFLPQHFSNKKVLGIVVPTVEEMTLYTKSGEIGVLATEATVSSHVYAKEVFKINPQIKVHEQACPLIVPIIETGEIEWEGLALILQKYLEKLFGKGKKIDTIVLGCTHYPLIEEKIKHHIPSGVTLISQGPIIAPKLKSYLGRHPEIETKLAKGEERLFFTTEKEPRIKYLSELFYGEPIELELVNLEQCTT